MPRPRNKENRGLPSRWRLTRGKYYYQVPPGMEAAWDGKKTFPLGKTLHEAHRTYAERVATFEDVRRMEQLCDRYALEVVPLKADATQRSNTYSLRRIRKAFHGNSVLAVQPHHIYQYRDHVGRKESKKKANLDLEVLSHMFTKAIEWGLRPDHPMTNKKVVKYSLAPRRVKPVEEELVAFLATLPRKWQLYHLLKIWCGRRKGEMLRLERTDFTKAGIRFVNNKPPYDEFIIPWEVETLAMAKELLAMDRKISSKFIFCTRKGQPYIKEDGTTSGFDSIYNRRIRKAIADGIVTVRFTEHDLRKVRPSTLPPAEAQALLRHRCAKQTDTYRLGPDIVRLNSTNRSE